MISKEAALERTLSSLGSVVVAYSGGVGPHATELVGLAVDLHRAIIP